MSRDHFSWSESAEQCRRLHGGRLAVVASAGHLSAVGSMLASAGHAAAWIAGRREVMQWTWSDGTRLGTQTRANGAAQWLEWRTFPDLCLIYG